jgi:O-antigen/teichoic acid export membrane protein
VAPAGGQVRGAITIASGVGVAQIIVIASSPFLTRLFDPAEFGTYSVGLAILAIMAVLACLSYENAIPLPRRDRGAADILALCILTTALVTVGFGLTFVLVGPAIADALDVPELQGLVPLLVAGVFAAGLVNSFIAWAVRIKSYGEIAANRITERVVTVAVQLSLGWLGWGAAGLLTGVVAGSLLAALRLAIVVWRGHSVALRGVTRLGIARAARRYRRFALLTTPADLLNTVGREAPLFLIVLLFGAAVGGQYALAFRVMALPLTLLARAIGQPYYAEAARISRRDPTSLQRLYVRTTKTLAMVTIVPILLGAVLSPFLFGFIFGPEWEQAGLFAAILAPMCYLQIVTQPTRGTLGVLERQDLHLAREVARAAFVGGAVIVAWALGLAPVGAVAAISVAGILTYVLYGVTTWRAVAHASAQAAQESRDSPDRIAAV